MVGRSKRAASHPRSRSDKTFGTRDSEIGRIRKGVAACAGDSFSFSSRLIPNPDSRFPKRPMSDVIDYRLIGDDLQAVIITLDPGEMVQAEAGSMMYMQDGIV